MPNWVINRIRTDKENFEKIIKKHISKDPNGDNCFDFNTILKMPEELKIEKSTRSADGLRLYIAKISPFISALGEERDKMPPANYFKEILHVFGKDCVDNMAKYILRPSEIEDLREKYKQDFNNVIDLGEKVYRNIQKYGVPDWYDWSVHNWGTKWNSCNTWVDLKTCSICFDTAWSPATLIIEKLAKLYPKAKIIFSFAEEQTGYYSGQSIFKDGELVDEELYKPFSKEAYEMSFELWGSGDEYEFDEETDTYEYIDPNQNDKE